MCTHPSAVFLVYCIDIITDLVQCNIDKYLGQALRHLTCYLYLQRDVFPKNILRYGPQNFKWIYDKRSTVAYGELELKCYNALKQYIKRILQKRICIICSKSQINNNNKKHRTDQ